MTTEGLYLNRAVVFGSAIVYWAGVWIQARRVRRQIGRSPNTLPGNAKEKLLWAGWSFVVAAWLALPFLTGDGTRSGWAAIIPWLVQPASLVLGLIMVLVGYAGTLWCYAAMGNVWRMGINQTETTVLVTRGPYRWVRHPIYLCQIVLVTGITALLPTILSFIILAIQTACILTKSADEEAHLRTHLGRSYAAYCARTGRWFPRFRREAAPAASLAVGNQDQPKPAE